MSCIFRAASTLARKKRVRPICTSAKTPSTRTSATSISNTRPAKFPTSIIRRCNHLWKTKPPLSWPKSHASKRKRPHPEKRDHEPDPISENLCGDSRPRLPGRAKLDRELSNGSSAILRLARPRKAAVATWLGASRGPFVVHSRLGPNPHGDGQKLHHRQARRGRRRRPPQPWSRHGRSWTHQIRRQGQLLLQARRTGPAPHPRHPSGCHLSSHGASGNHLR